MNDVLRSINKTASSAQVDDAVFVLGSLRFAGLQAYTALLFQTSLAPAVSAQTLCCLQRAEPKEPKDQKTNLPQNRPHLHRFM
ncbi:hypothetical protein SAMN05444359_14018 [Neolewinella agarilytica]|uniref:Uncharacterized protein n=1 Tax=Neolewinella agarilytica TaxID=478744 RepID=A0A1H9NWM2_9BACT|nr:hypothetical protein SAMN05444359_14018 [Neolewinella agarilytica]